MPVKTLEQPAGAFQISEGKVTEGDPGTGQPPAPALAPARRGLARPPRHVPPASPAHGADVETIRWSFQNAQARPSS